jgi:hypothetical protein
VKRADFIQQKETVQAEIRRTRAALATTQPRHAGEHRQLEAHLQSLMTREHHLRLQIDQAPRDHVAQTPLLSRSTGQWLPLLRKSLARKGNVRWQLSGDSMAPTLPLACEIEIAPLPSVVPLGSLVVFVSGDSLVAHRLVRSERDRWITQGDGRRGPDNAILVTQVLGLVVAAYDNGDRCWPSPGSRIAGWLWVARHHMLRPVRWAWCKLRRN